MQQVHIIFQFPNSSYAESDYKVLIFCSTSDSILLTGHIKLLKSLLSCQGVDKRAVGGAVIPQFLTTYLFPASKLISEGGLTDTAGGQTTSRSDI